MINKLRFTLAQINIVSGDLEGNYNKIVNIILDHFKNDKSDVIIFPETAISGYCVGSLFDRIDFIQDQEEKVKSLMNIVPYNKMVIIGFVSLKGIRKTLYPRICNSVAVINNNQFQVYDKQLLANTDHHEDRKYFESGKITKVFDVCVNNTKFKLGTPICEDVWYTDHTRNISQEMIDMGANILISINQSYFYCGKNIVRKKLYSNISVPFITVNAVGIGDIVKNILIYDGSSMVFNNKNLEHILPSFKESIQTIILEKLPLLKEKDNIENLNEYTIKKKFQEIVDALVFEQKELFKIQGFKKAQIHLSGGLDSSVVAALTLLTHNVEDIVFITNPSSFNTPKIYNNVKHIEKRTGIKVWVNSIQEIYDKILEVDEKSFNTELSDVAKSCIQASLRTCLGLYNAHRFKSTLISTTNHTELCLGFSTYLDISYAGIHTLIGDLTKIELYQLAKYLNEEIFKIDVIPTNLYNGLCKPSAELPDNQGEDPIDYYIQSGLCSEIVRMNKSRKQLLFDFKNKNLTNDYFPVLTEYNNKSIYELYTIEQFTEQVDFSFRKLKSSVYKAAQCPPVPLISKRGRAFSDRETLINKYNY
jgi:NAD+ synthase (glutamine-hydrolysing)